MSVLGELLFYKRNGPTLDDYLRHRGSVELEASVDRLPESVFGTKTDDEIVAQVVGEISMAPLEIFVDRAQNEVVELPVEVRDIFSGGTVRVNGLRATKSIPFQGMPELWKMQTNPYDLNPPRGDVQGRTLELGIEVRAGEDATVAEHIRSTIANVLECIGRQAAQIATFNQSLPPKVAGMVSGRRARLNAAQALKNKF
jgi:hypothetical protein